MTERKIMSKRYNHWFWNSLPIKWLARRVVKLDSWLWYKQYGSQRVKGLDKVPSL